MKTLGLTVAFLAAAAWTAGAQTPAPTFEVQVAQGLAAYPKGSVQLSSRESAGSAPGAFAATADYCIATLRSGEEGAPNYWFQVECQGQKPVSSPDRWCWSFRQKKHLECMGQVIDALGAMMRGKGYEEAGRFSRVAYETEQVLYLRSDSASERGKRYCLARRWDATGPASSGKARIDYEIDCGNGSVTTLANAEPDGRGTAGILQYMQKMGYALAATLDGERGRQRLIFQQR